MTVEWPSKLIIFHAGYLTIQMPLTIDIIADIEDRRTYAIMFN